MDSLTYFRKQVRAAAGVDGLLLLLLIIASFAIAERRELLDWRPSGFAASPNSPVEELVLSQVDPSDLEFIGGLPRTLARRAAAIGPRGGTRDRAGLLGGGVPGVAGTGEPVLGGVPGALASAPGFGVGGGGDGTGLGGGGGGGGGPGSGIGGPGGGGGGPGGFLPGGGGGGGGSPAPAPPIIVAVPEPSTWLLMVLAIGAVGAAARVKRRRARVAITG